MQNLTTFLAIFASSAQRETIENEIATWRKRYPNNTISATARNGRNDGESVIYLNIIVDTQLSMPSFFAGGIRVDGSFLGDDEPAPDPWD